MNGLVDSLDNIPEEDFPKLLELCKDGYPDGVHAYAFLCTLKHWKQKRPSLEVFHLAPGGDYRKGVFFFCIHDKDLIGSAYVHDEESKEALKAALSSTKRIPSVNRFLMTCMTKRTTESIEDYLKSNMIMTEELVRSQNGDKVFWMPWEEAKDIEVQVPDGVELKFLSPSHADQINNAWPHKHEGSRDFIAEMISVNFGMGVFRGEELLAWALYWFYGGIGTVQTEEKEKRKGYGRAVVQAVTKELGKQQTDVHLNIVEGNKVGEEFFISLGFKFCFKSFWAFKGYGEII